MGESCEPETPRQTEPPHEPERTDWEPPKPGAQYSAQELKWIKGWMQDWEHESEKGPIGSWGPGVRDAQPACVSIGTRKDKGRCSMDGQIAKRSKPRELLVGVARYGRRSRRIRLWAVMMLVIVAALVVQALFPERGLLPTSWVSLGAGTALIVFLAALFCEYIDSSLGMGYGTTLTPLLLLAGFEPLQVVPAVLFSEFLTGLTAGLLHHRDGNVDLRRDRRVQEAALSLGGLSVIGTLAAVTLALSVPKFWLTFIIAIIILSMGVVILATIRRQFAFKRSRLLVLGGIAAFNKGLSGGGYGPLVTGGQVVSGMTSKQAVAVTSLAESLTCLVGLAAYMLLRGNLDWALAAPLAIGALMSVPLATLTVRKLPEGMMRAGVGVATCALGALALSKLFW